ncbi:MAG: PD-(D/E)XK nuclease family protein [candidate division WOR-3 bacterium]
MKFEPEIVIYKTPQNILEKICDEILKEGDDFSEILIIFPNKRPKVYLKKILHEKLKKPFIMPQVFSFQEFAYKVLVEKESFEFIDILDAVYILKDIFDKKDKKIFGEKFSDFFEWGLRILKAMDELIMNEVDFEKVKILKEYADIPENVKAILDILKEIKEEFCDEILRRKKILDFILFKKLKEMDFDLDYKKVIFAGFYALLPLEEFFIKRIMDKCPTKMIFLMTRESDAIFKFLKKNGFNYKIVESELERPKINFIKLNDFYTQSIYIREKLKDVLKSRDATKIGIILPEPLHLESLIGEIGTDIDSDFNISMGYSFRLTPLFSLIRNFFEVRKSSKDNKVYFSSLLNFVNHPFIISCFKDEVIKIDNKVKNLNQEKGKVYFSFNEVVEDSFDREFLFILNCVFVEVKTIKNFIENMREILGILYKRIKGKENTLFEIFMNETFEIFNKLLQTEIKDIEFEIEDLSKIILFYLKREIIPLRGDPLKGFQIIGVLEARLIPFEVIFFLDLIEGIYPKSYKYDPILPESLRKILNLPSYKENESIYAYNFYQIVENAHEVYLLFYEDEKNEGYSESRFIQRLLWEKEKEERRVLYDEIPFYSYTPLLTKEKRKVIEKDETVINILKKKGEEGFHVTEIDEYLKCPFSFYQKVILENKEEKGIEEDIESTKLGEFLHRVMEEFYIMNFKDREIRWNDSLKNNFLNFLSEKFDEFFGKERETLWVRKEYLILKMGKFIEKIKEEKGILRSVEVRVEEVMNIDGLEVKIKGKIDRIDELFGSFRIVDYKSSGSNLNYPCVPSNFKDRREIKEEVKSLQIPIYALIYSKMNDSLVKRGAYYIFSSGEIKEFEFGEVIKRTKKSVLNLKEAEEILFNVLTEIYNKDIPFEPDSKTGNCKSCPYRGICGEF